jgi:hypothetical protein
MLLYLILTPLFYNWEDGILRIFSQSQATTMEHSQKFNLGCSAIEAWILIVIKFCFFLCFFF